MALAIIDEACTFEPDRSKGTIVIESDQDGPPFEQAFHELGEMSAVHMAQSYAVQHGVGNAMINGNKVGPYPVNAEGLSLEMVRDNSGKSLPQSHPRMQPKRYRIEVLVARPFR